MEYCGVDEEDEGGDKKEEGAGVAGMASGVKEEDGATAVDSGTGGSGAPSAWRKTTVWVWLGR